MTANKNKALFTRQLLKWNADLNKRPMPWKGEKDPYKIWLSEIILQQTRVEQGWNYYNRFVTTFPTVHELAKAPETKVFKLWEGLGYYTRCKNLIATAKIIAKEKKGVFPNSYEEILKLKGIGPYTAAAIASFAFDLPFAVVDGNVFRVLARYFGIDKPIDSNEGKKIFSSLADELLYKQHPGIYNQALMDFGAVVCKPKLPACSTCPLKKSCVAYLNGSVNDLPVKEKKIIKRTRWLYYLLIQSDHTIAVKKRGAKDIWENLYEFVLIEEPARTTVKKILLHKAFKTLMGKEKYIVKDISEVYKQQLTHQTIYGQFIKINVSNNYSPKGYEMLPIVKIKKLAFPKFITSYLETISFS